MLRPDRVGFLDGHAAPTGCPRSAADARATRKTPQVRVTAAATPTTIPRSKRHYATHGGTAASKASLASDKPFFAGEAGRRCLPPRLVPRRDRPPEKRKVAGQDRAAPIGIQGRVTGLTRAGMALVLSALVEELCRSVTSSRQWARGPGRWSGG
jgi:hypothetical protein